MERIELTHGQFSNLKKKGTPKISAEVMRDYPSLCSACSKVISPGRMLGHTFSLLAPITLSHIPRVEFAHNRRAAAAAIRQHLANPRRVQRKTD